MARYNSRMGSNRSRSIINRPKARGGGDNGNGSYYNTRAEVQTNLNAARGQYVNARTGRPYSGPIHKHNGRPMVGAKHSRRPHDYLKRTRPHDHLERKSIIGTPTYNVYGEPVGGGCFCNEWSNDGSNVTLGGCCSTNEGLHS